MRRSFVETGAANSIFGLADEIGAGFVGSDDQLQMTPFQRQTYEALKAKEAREQQEKMEQGGGGGGPTPNSLHGSGGKKTSDMQGETVRYESEDENSEANTSFVD